MPLLDVRARLVIGHRGAAGEWPENTMLSFQRAVQQGADALELDVRVTADGVPVVIHDATVDRTTDGVGEVRTLSARALTVLDAGQGQRIPRLADVLEGFPETPLIIEVKEREAAASVAELVRRSRAAQRVLVGSFDRAALRLFRPPEFARAAGRGETAVFWALSRIGLAPPAPAYAAFAVPERYARLRVVDGTFVRAARERGKPVHVWTVNDLATARRLLALGVAGIITDYPERIRTALSSLATNHSREVS